VNTGQEKVELLLSLRQQGVRGKRVLEAIEQVPREAFMEEVFAGKAYADKALPIACGQTISQPFVVALMTDRLSLEPHHKVLEIGTGSGYQTAILARLCKRVYSIERYRTLSRKAAETFRKLKIANVIQLLGDGHKGWAQQAPFDRIIVTAAAKEVPPALIEQLTPGGIMVIPIEHAPNQQDLYRVTRTEEGFEQEHMIPVRFVPLVEGIAREA
jgi:protein-L-isoaspartate(D-aspartate) O-methyltransferase